jgi:hypothetical protein
VKLRVFAEGERLKVGRVDTELVFAFVMKVDALGYRSVQQEVGHAVSHRRLTVEVELAVTLSVPRCGPKPAPFGYLDLLPKPLFNGASLLYAEVVPRQKPLWFALGPPVAAVRMWRDHGLFAAATVAVAVWDNLIHVDLLLVSRPPEFAARGGDLR